MALSGSFTGSTNNQYVKPKITWSATQNQAENYSMVTATLTYSRTNSGYTTSGKWNGSITINGVTTSVSTTEQIYITQNSNTKAMSATVKVPHNADGSKSITISCTGAIPAASLQSTSCSATVTLTSIPRQAKITSASDFTDVDNPSISFSNPGGFPMDVWLEPNPVGDHLCVRKNIPNTGSFTWELTDAEREELRNKCAGLKCTIRVGLYSNISGKEYADYKDKTFYMTENTATKPTVTLAATLNNSSLPSQFDGLYIQGKSRLDVSITAQGKYSAGITSYSANIGGEVYNSQSFLSNVLLKEGKVDVIGYAKDSRQFTGSAKQEIEVTPYSKPLVIPLGSETAIQCYRSDGNGTRIGNSTSVWIKAKRSYYSLSGINNCALQWRRKLVTDEWDDGRHLWQDLIPKTDTTNTEYNALIPNEVFDLRTSYSVQIRAIDDIGEKDIKNFEVPTQDVALHLGKGGKNVSIGTYCDYSEDYTFYSDWKAIFDKEVIIRSQQLVDFVVEQGTVGVWTYEKWASGKAKCWASINIEVVTESTAGWGDMFVASCESANDKLTFPFEFLEIPHCIVSLSGDSESGNSANFWIATRNEGVKLTTTTAQQVQLIRPTAATIPQGITLHYQVEGRWKNNIEEEK